MRRERHVHQRVKAAASPASAPGAPLAASPLSEAGDTKPLATSGNSAWNVCQPLAGPARKRCLTAHPDALSAVRKASCDHQEQQKATANVLLKKHQRGVRSVLREQRKVCSSSFVALKQPALKQPTGTPAEAGTHECPQELLAYPHEAR